MSTYYVNLPYSHFDFFQCIRTRRHSTTGFPGQRHRSARELADAELQRAIQLSLQEMNGPNGQAHPGYVPYQSSPSKWGYSEPPLVQSSIPEEDDPDLRAAIEASLREGNAPERQHQSEYSQSNPEISQNAVPKVPDYDLAPLEADAILTFNQTVEHVQAQGGRDLSRYPAVTELYDKASGIRPKLAMSMDDTGRKEREWHFVLQMTIFVDLNVKRCSQICMINCHKLSSFMIRFSLSKSLSREGKLR